MSRHFGYDYQYITKIFKKAFGVCIREYILSKKMKHAKELLTGGSKSVVEVSELLGYAVPNNFSRAFKKQYGISPKEYKAQKKGYETR